MGRVRLDARHRCYKYAVSSYFCVITLNISFNMERVELKLQLSLCLPGPPGTRPPSGWAECFLRAMNNMHVYINTCIYTYRKISHYNVMEPCPWSGNLLSCQFASQRQNHSSLCWAGQQQTCLFLQKSLITPSPLCLASHSTHSSGFTC